MERRLRYALFGLLLAGLPARGAVRDIPVVPAEIGGVSAASGASGLSAPLSLSSPGLGAAPALAPALSAPAALPTAAAAIDGPISYNPAVPAEPALAPQPSEKHNGLQQLNNALTARGDEQSKAMAEKLYYTDPLTGLPNRAYFVEKGAKALEGVQDPTVAMLDMNNFGAVNVGLAEVHGVTKGRSRADEVLAMAGAILGELSKDGATTVRLGGEEFVVLGSRKDVLKLSAVAQAVMTPERLLRSAGIVPQGEERRAIRVAMERAGRADQPVADFTYGVAELRGRSLGDAVKAADEALNHAKEAGGRGRIELESAEGYSTWTPPPGMAEDPLVHVLPRPARPDTAADLAALESRLHDKEKALFREAAFKDPLTLTRTYDFVDLQAAEWNRRYADGGVVVLSSARNLKQINDILGHEAGDRYLRKLGVILRQSLNKARIQQKLDAQEPVRVASKEFLLVGRDAETVAKLAADAVAQSFNDGRMLTPEEVARLRREAGTRGLVPPDRVKLIGNLRLVTESISEGGRADSKGALDRAFVRLEAQKRGEDGTTTTVKTSFSAN